MAQSDKQRRFFGPGTVIAAAFIGPGTVTTCSVAGLQFGYSLLWALVFSIFATIVLQEMSSRLGLAGQMGLGTALREKYPEGMRRILISVLVVSALGIGCAAYESGNISGAAMGIESLTGISVNVLSVFIGMFAFLLLWIGKYKLIERFLVSLVVIMGITFFITAVIIKPDLWGIVKGLIPDISDGSVYVAIGLIGTTVVPYNIFLHASIVRNRWKGKESLKDCRSELMFSIILGGIISGAIIVTSAGAFFGTGTELGDLKSSRVRIIWMVILLTGIIFSAAGFKPIPLIIFAQVTNGLLLSIIAVILIIVLNDKRILGDMRNSVIRNVLGIFIVIVAFLLGCMNVLKVFRVF